MLYNVCVVGGGGMRVRRDRDQLYGDGGGGGGGGGGVRVRWDRRAREKGRRYRMLLTDCIAHLQIMCALGNARVNAIYEYEIPSHVHKPKPHSPRSVSSQIGKPCLHKSHDCNYGDICTPLK